MKLKLLFFLIFGFLSNFLKSQEIEIRLGRQIKCPYDLEDVSTKVPRPMGPLPTDDEFRIRQSGNVSSALPTATFIVNYSGNVTQDAVDAFEYAINIWAHELVSPVPIEINLELDAFEGGFLAFANQNEARNFPNAPKVNRWYPTALANSLAGVDLAPESADIFISFATRTDWYYGTDGNPPSGFFDFVTIALHEIGHGLGMVAFRSLASDGSGFYTSGGDPMVYSDFLEDGDGVSLISLPDGSIAVGNMFTGENLFANGVNSVLALDGRKPKVYAPDNFASGSSIVHWDERTFRSGTTNSLMTPFFSRSESNFDVGDITRGHFRDIGWLLNPDVQFPTNTAPQITSSAIIRVDEGQLVAIDVETTDDSSSEGDGLRYDLTGDIDDDLFRIDRDTGVVTFTPAPDFENPADANGDNIYEIQVTVEDFGNFIDVQNITIEVIDIDDVPPGLVSLFPTPDSVDHPIGDNLTMTFTEPIAFGLGTIEIRKVLDDSTVESFDVQNASNIAIDGSVLSIDPTLNLFGGTQYYILVDAGAITDLSGVTFEGIPNSTIWGFTTEIDEATAFITTWSVSDTGSNARSVLIGDYNNIYNYNFSVDWGDGTKDHNLTDGLIHTYENAGTYTIKIAGDYPWARFSTIGTLLTVDQWGNIQWKSMQNAFSGLSGMDVQATDIPNLSGVTSMAGMFANCDSLFGNSAFGNWDVSSIVDMSGVFVRTSFNQDISSWDVSSVIDMSEMFFSAFEFNQDIGSWDVSSVVDMARMFAHNSGTESDPPIFNQYIGGWDVSKVTDMSYMFSNAPAFNQDIGGWNVAAVTNMEYMFNHATAFNQNLNNWNVSAVENMKAMFFEATSFNSPLSNWNPSAVIDMSSMFEGATAFNQNLDGFNIPRVENLSRMFALATSFNGQLSAWNTVSVTDMGGMFQGATAFNQNLDSWNVSSVTSMDKMFLGATSFNGDIGNWDVSNVKDFLDMFADAVNFNQDLGNWNVGSAETMVSMFSGATNFNQNIGTWNVSNVSFMAGMFRNAISFDQNLSNWNVEKVISMSGMFDGVKLSTENYDSVLNSWAALNVQSGVRFDGGFSKYCEGEASRANLIDNRGWQITDGGEDCPDTVSTSIFISEYLDSTSFNKAIELFNPNDEAVDLSKFVLGRVSNGGSGIEGAILLTGLLPPKETYVIAHPNALSAILDKADLTSFTLFHDGNDAYILLKGTTDLTRSTVVDFFGTGDLSIPEINNPGDEWNDGNFGTRRVTLRRKPSVPFGNPKGFDPITTLSAEWNSVGISVFDGLGSHEFGFEEDNIPPELTCSEPIQVGQDEGVCDALVTLVDPTATDDISLPENITIEGTRSDGLSLSDAFPVGETTISWTATDEAGNSASCNQVVTVFDTEDPQIQTAIIGDPEFENSFEQCGAVIFYDTPTATDNCPGVLIEQTEGLASGSLFPIGETLNTYVATDAAGNTASFSFTIIVNDTEVPQAICQDIALELDQNGIAQIVPSDVDGGSTDNCGIASMEVSPSSFGINDVGENTVTLTITDEVGNSNTCEAIVTVNEFQRPFVTTWKTDNPGVSEDNQITIPTFPGETYDYTVDWGDGSTSENVTGDITHTYEFPGTYTVSISGDFPRIYFNNVVIGIPTLGDEEKILSVNQWGSIVWTSMLGAFAGCKNLDVLATDVPDLSNVFDMTGMFRFCESLIGNSSFNNWDVSNVTQMGNLFENAFIFNQNIGSWNVSNVTFMSDLFNNAASFNQDLSNWNVGRVEQMALTFGGASSFNQDIGNWNVSNVKEMLGMFAGATSFNQDISGWNMENVERTQAMFSGATAFNQDLSGWNVSNVTSFNVMFFGATAFDHDLGSWDVQRVSNMDEMFGDSGLSTSNYDNTLIGWAQLPNLQQNVPFGAGNSQFCLGEEARQLLIDDFGWNINDAGKVADCQRPFITTWITSNQGISDDNTIWIPTSPALGYDFTVNWGDGNFDFNVTGDVSHTYDNPGTYTVSISGIFGGIAFNSFPGNEANSDATKLVEVNQWGDIVWQSMTSAFAGCSNMDVVATDAPDLTNVDSLFSTFAYCSTMTGENSLRNWDVSTITDLTQTFYTCSNFNEDISGWDVRNVINMTNLFLICTSFDQDLSPWDVSNVRNMSGMFYGANVFDQPIGNWDVGQVENMRNMFAFAHSFNQDLSNWNVGNVLDMSYMFSFNDIFNQDIGNWDVANVQTMEGLFQNSVFDQDLSEWNVSMVGNMSFMFNNSSLSNENYDTILIGWSQLPSLQNGVTLDALLNQYCSAADARQSIIDTYGWSINDAGEATNCEPEQRPFVTTWKTDNPGISEDNQITIPTFPGETYNYTVDWGDGTTSENVMGDITHTYEVPGTYTVSISGIFPRIFFNGQDDTQKDFDKILTVVQWGDIKWQSMERAFNGCIFFDVLATDVPDLSEVVSMHGMFWSCRQLIGNTSFTSWDVSNVRDMSFMFMNAERFNQDIGGWTVSKVNNMSRMFRGAEVFNQNIGLWDVSNVELMDQMFTEATSFNEDIGNWNVSKVTNMDFMFAQARSFNQDISSWDVGNVTIMRAMFSNARAFNQDIGAWNVSNVTQMNFMFSRADSFNQDIGSWDVSKVERMDAMFQGTKRFNQNISDWDVSRVTEMDEMFQQTESFNQDISSWNISQVNTMYRMFREASLSNENYDKMLIGWSRLPSLQNGVQLDAPNNQYCLSKEARQNIIDTYDWTINDAGEAEDCQRPFITMWDTRLPGGTDNLIVIGTHEDLIYNYNIDWGDGSSSINVVGDAVHRYETPGLYEVSINGTFPGINLGRSTLEKRRLIEIKQWGDIEWETFEQAFNGCLNMDVIARDIPDLTRVKSLANMFGGCVSLLGNTSFNNWDVSQITNMFGTFGFAQQFNQNIAAWDVSNVQDMTAMFAGLEIFNQDIGDWDVSSVISMFQMFDGASRFNQDISGWNVISVENMSLMFRDAISFNQDISGWNVANNTRMRDMFAGAILFNQNLGDWNISQVVDAFRLFNNSGLSNENYDQTLIGWSQLPSLQNGVTLDALQNQYCEAKEARQLIIDTYGWTINDAGEAEDCEAIVDCPANLPNEDAAIVLPEGNSFLGIDEVLGTSEMTNDSDCALALVNNDSGQLFANYRIPIDLVTNGIQAGDELFISLDGNSSEGVARIELLRDNTPNQAELSYTYIGGWSTFSETIIVPEGISSLDIWLYSNYLSNEPGTAYYDNLIVQNLSSEDRPFVTIWKTDNTGFTADNQIEIPTFPGETYNYTVDWGDGSTNEGVLGNITHTYEVPGTYTVSISGVFPRIFFNGQLDIDKDFSKILSIQQWGDIEWSSMRGAFDTCFNLSMDANDTPDLSNVSDLSAMFVSCALEDNPSFNNWNVSTVERMNGMFFASSFNSDISNWDVSNVTSMQEMFFFSDFNRDISNWDVGKLENMATMFSNSPFDQDISNWNISNVSVAFGMFNNSGFSNENYDNILIGWSQLTFLQNGVTLDAPQNQFCLGKDARQLIIDTYGWTFNDAGEAEDCSVVEDCPDDLPNEDSTIPLIGQGGFQGLDGFAGTSAQTNGSPCALMVTNNDVNQPFANYRIPIDLAAYGINPGDELFISLDGNSSEGVARIEVNQDNQPNTALASNTYLGGWSTFSETVVVPSGITTINLWLYSNYLSNAPGIAYYDNLIVTNLSEIDVPCPDDLPNEELSIPLVGQGGFQGLDSFTANSTITNDSPCALEVTNTDADQPFANYRIPIVLEDHGISPGDQLLISLDGNSLAGTARIEVNQDNSPNSALASNTYEGGWSTFSEIIVVPEGITSINLWLYSNYLNFDSGGTAYYDNLIVRNLGPLAVPATFDLNSLDLWPNPANETVNISFERPTEVVEFQIFDLMGRLIRTFKVDNRSSKFELPVYDLPVGAYFIKTMDENGQLYDEQMMIQR